MSYHPDLISTALKMLTALAVILGVLLILFHVFRRVFRSQLGNPAEKQIRVLENSYLGVKKNISLVRVPGAVLVLGITNDNIRLLTKIEDKETLERIKGFEGEKASLSFSGHFQKLSSRFRMNRNEE